MSDLMNKPVRGRHRASTAQEIQRQREAERTQVPADVRMALERAVLAVGDLFDESEWTFDRSLMLGWVVRRDSDETPGVGERSTLGISADCRTRWVPADADPDEVLSQLERETSTSRSHIEFLLSEANRFYRGGWHVTPVEDLGWICARPVRFGRERYYVVTRERRVVRVEQPDAESAATVLCNVALGSPEQAVA